MFDERKKKIKPIVFTSLISLFAILLLMPSVLAACTNIGDGGTYYIDTSMTLCRTNYYRNATGPEEAAIVINGSTITVDLNGSDIINGNTTCANCIGIYINGSTVTLKNSVPGNKAGPTAYGSDGIYINNNWADLINVSSWLNGGTGVYVSALAHHSYVRGKNSYIHNNTGFGINAFSNNFSLIDIPSSRRIYGNGAGGVFISDGDGWVFNVTIGHNEKTSPLHGLTLTENNHVVDTVTVMKHTSDGFHIDLVDNSNFDDLVAEYVGGDLIELDQVTNSDFDNVGIDNATTQGLRIRGCKNLTVDNLNISDTQSEGIYISDYIVDGKNITIKDFDLYNTGIAALSGVYMVDVDLIRLIDGIINDTGSYGIFADGSGGVIPGFIDLNFTRVDIWDTELGGVYLDIVNDSKFVDVNVYDSLGACWNVIDGGDLYIYSVIVEDCEAEGFYFGAGVGIDTINVTLSNFYINDTLSDGVYGQDVDTLYFYNGIVNNSGHGAPGNGFEFEDNADTILIDNVTIEYPNGDGLHMGDTGLVNNINITNSRIKIPTSYGIHAEANIHTIRAVNVNITDSVNHGIYIEAPSSSFWADNVEILNSGGNGITANAPGFNIYVWDSFINNSLGSGINFGVLVGNMTTCEIHNTNISYSDNHGILLSEPYGVQIVNVSIHNTTIDGINFDGGVAGPLFAVSLFINKTYIRDTNGEGIYGTDSDFVYMYDNRITNSTKSGFFLANTTYGIVDNLTIYNGGTVGVNLAQAHFDACHYFTGMNWTINTSSSWGIIFKNSLAPFLNNLKTVNNFEGMYIDNCSNGYVRNSVFNGVVNSTTRYGLALDSSTEFEIIGINVSYSSGVFFIDNINATLNSSRIHTNGTGVNVTGNSDGTIIWNNYINASKVRDDTAGVGVTYWNQSYCAVSPNILGGVCTGGNWYSRTILKTYDDGSGPAPAHNSKADGIGDNPWNYTIPGIGGFSDKLPLSADLGPINVTINEVDWDPTQPNSTSNNVTPAWNYTVFDTDFPANFTCELFIKPTGGAYSGYGTFANISNNSWALHTPNASLSDGFYVGYLNCSHNESFTNSSTWSFLVDTVAPNITIWTDSTNGTAYQDWIFVNVTANDANALHTTTIFLYNSSGQINSTSGAGASLSFNFTGLPYTNYTYNVSANDSSGNTGWSSGRNVTLLSGGVTISFHANTTAAGNQSQTWIYVSVNVTSGAALDTVRIYIYNTSGLVSNATNTTPFHYNFTGLADGTYYLNASANDTLGNRNITATRVIDLDTTAPHISFNANTTVTGNYTQDWIYANLNFSDAGIGIDNATIYLYNSTGLVLSVKNATSPFTYNFTGLPDETYYLNGSVNDTLGNRNTTATRVIGVDTTAPHISFNANTTSAGNQSQNWIYASANVSGGVIDTVRIYIYRAGGFLYNASSNQSFSYNFTGIVDGEYYLNASVNDTLGNRNITSTRTIELDTGAPYFTNFTTNDSYIKSGGSVFMTFNVTDANLVASTINATVVNVSGTNYVTDVNESCFRDPSGIFNCNLTFAPTFDGNFSINVTANDGASNTNTSNSFTVDGVFFIRDSVAPAVALHNSSTTGTITSRSIFVNITASASPAGLLNITIRLYTAAGGSYGTSTGNTSPYTHNFTTVANGQYLYNGSACDRSGNCNSTSETWNVTVNYTVSSGSPGGGGPDGSLYVPPAAGVNSDVSMEESPTGLLAARAPPAPVILVNSTKSGNYTVQYWVIWGLNVTNETVEFWDIMNKSEMFGVSVILNSSNFAVLSEFNEIRGDLSEGEYYLVWQVLNEGEEVVDGPNTKWFGITRLGRMVTSRSAFEGVGGFPWGVVVLLVVVGLGLVFVMAHKKAKRRKGWKKT